LIHNLDITDFLQNYWQKKPLLIKGAFPDYQSPISAEELAGLACENFVESRIISEQQSEPNWILENGPFNEERFASLPDSNWTLLIQGLNKIIPEIDDLLHQFTFIPTWRIDDLMASYAAPNGSVGPHIDQYDVFLLQAKGRRHWKISEQPVAADNFEKNVPLKIIKSFQAESEWILEAGDMLYLPPNIAHYGIGLEECMTFSIGFRAPSHAELLSDFIDEHLADLTDEQRYQDSDLSKNKYNGEISNATISNVQNILLSHFNNLSNIEDWFGEFITRYLTEEDSADYIVNKNNVSAAEFKKLLSSSKELRRPANVRANYLHNTSSGLKLFINGQKFPIEKEVQEIAELFCNHHILNIESINLLLKNDKNLNFLTQLYNDGFTELSGT